MLIKSKDELIKEFPIVKELSELKETVWINDGDGKSQFEGISMEDILDASKRLERFAPFIMSAFPETMPSNGIIESEIANIEKMKSVLLDETKAKIEGKLLMKLDSHLPISGSIKARGGIYEVLTLAEKLALEAGKISLEDDYSKFDTDEMRAFLSNYSIAVGSTGNLGLSIGIMGAKLGFKTTVHMSADAREWKKSMLRSKGVTVIEYQDDYSKAVEEGRHQASLDDKCHFVDDENSKTLFMGYAVAALRLKDQLCDMGILVDAEHPLFVYLPCGVGGGPGGIAFGLENVYGKNAYSLFAEPTHSPCMLLGMATGYHDKIAVSDIGVDNITAADGLAVGRASGFVGKVMEGIIRGVFTVSDERMYRLLSKLDDIENIKLEPSALAGMIGASITETNLAFKNINFKNATHLIWATGGSMVPKDVYEEYYKKGKELSL